MWFLLVLQWKLGYLRDLYRTFKQDTRSLPCKDKDVFLVLPNAGLAHFGKAGVSYGTRHR
jgi:hypothetical protein